MKKILPILLVFLPIIFTILGHPIGEKTASMSILYGITATISLILLIMYCLLLRNKDKWFVLLFSSVFVVNLGYYMLSISTTIDSALFANRVSYFGSVFLPFSILMSILKISHINVKKIVPFLLLLVAIIMFFITASPGILDIYYKEVSLNTVNGITVLNKTYGSLHCLYLYYLLLYFIAMITVVIYSKSKDKIKSSAHAFILISAVLVNLLVWLIEQLIKIDFEILSISYIITEVFLLGLYYLIQEHQFSSFDFMKLLTTSPITTSPYGEYSLERIEKFKNGLATLTEKEIPIFDGYVLKKPQKIISSETHLGLSSIKWHVGNIYNKLGVVSRKELIEINEIVKNIEKEP